MPARKTASQPMDDDFVVWSPKPAELPPLAQPPAEQWVAHRTHERSAAFVAWLADCQTVVDRAFGPLAFTLSVKSIKDFLWITMRSKHQTRVFAFVAKANGNIHCPAVFDSPFEVERGNIHDPHSRLACITAWGVRTEWSWLPTYPNSQRFTK